MTHGHDVHFYLGWNMNLFTEAIRMMFALTALILTTMLTQPLSFHLSPIGQSVSLKEQTAKLPSFVNFHSATKLAVADDISVTLLDESDSQARTPVEIRQQSRQNLKIANLRPQYRARWKN